MAGSLRSASTAGPRPRPATVTAPADALNPAQRIDLALRVLVPELGGLPGSAGFVYSDRPFSHVYLPSIARKSAP